MPNPELDTKVREVHSLDIHSLMDSLDTTETGLTTPEAEARLGRDGHNELRVTPPKSLGAIFLEQFKDFMIIVLLVAAVVSAVVAREAVDSIVILILVMLNATIGTWQERKAQRSLDALKEMSAPHAKVIRDGNRQTVPARDLVRGDLVLLEAGDKVPADLRITESADLRIAEAALTGESLPVEKSSLPVEVDTPLAERTNLAFSSTLVTFGRGRALVVATAMETEVGTIATLIQDAPQVQTPMQKRLNSLGKVLGIGALAICTVMLIIGMAYGNDPMEMFMTAIALAVAAIPEGLPAISAVVLALGVQRMAKRHAIVRTLPSVESLGSATVICSDKTGTLTQNLMTVTTWADIDNQTPLEAASIAELAPDILRTAVLCTDASITGTGAIGDPTEIALVQLGADHDVDKTDLESEFPRTGEAPFESERKRMSTVNGETGALTIHTKGGMEEVLSVCSTIRAGSLTRPITPDDLEALRRINESMASQALRVLALATRDTDEVTERGAAMEHDLTFQGLVGMIDPPRPEARDAVAACYSAGITPVMITGDHLTTASAIARDLDILRDKEVTTGTSLEEMSDDELFEQVENISVYARVSPEHKVRIVEAWQRHGHVVAMTGDGVNDAPALSRADIGCAMGIVGTDVAKEAADMVLTDDNFATVVTAVEEGRRINDNVLKAVSFLLSSNIGEVITLFVAVMLNWATPLAPIHILLVNLVTDGMPALALGVDPAEGDIMERKAKRSQGIFTPGFIRRIVYQGALFGTITLTAHALGGADVVVAQTMAFMTLALSQVVHSFSVRSTTRSAFSKKTPVNRWLLAAAASSTLVVFICAYAPGINSALSLTGLGLQQLAIVIGLSIAPLFVVEAAKALRLNTTASER